MLQWAVDNRCPMDHRTCSYAAAGGHLAVLQWARQHGCCWNSTTTYHAAMNGNVDVLVWALKQQAPSFAHWTRCDIEHWTPAVKRIMHKHDALLPSNARVILQADREELTASMTAMYVVLLRTSPLRDPPSDLPPRCRIHHLPSDVLRHCVMLAFDALVPE